MLYHERLGPPVYKAFAAIDQQKQGLISPIYICYWRRLDNEVYIFNHFRTWIWLAEQSWTVHVLHCHVQKWKNPNRFTKPNWSNCETSFTLALSHYLSVCMWLREVQGSGFGYKLMTFYLPSTGVLHRTAKQEEIQNPAPPLRVHWRTLMISFHSKAELSKHHHSFQQSSSGPFDEFMNIRLWEELFGIFALFNNRFKSPKAPWTNVR